MSMGSHQKRRSEPLWIPSDALVRPAGHPFYSHLNQVLDESGFDAFVEGMCAKFYSEKLGRPGLVPGVYFRSLLVGYFEGIDSERGIAWRAADSLAIRGFLRIPLDETTPDHTTISRTRPADRFGDSSASVQLGAAGGSREGIAEGKDNRD